MAKATINIGTVPNDGTGDPIRTAMATTNANFTEIYNALGGDTLTNLVNSSAEIELIATSNKISFLYDTEAELLALDPATYHGCIGHAHDTGTLYYAHGAWRKLITDTSGGAVTSYTDPLANVAYSGQLQTLVDINGGVGSNAQVLTSNGDGTFQFADQTGGGGGSQNVFSTIAVSGQNDIVADATTDTLTFVGGTNVTITTDDSTDTITINAAGGGGGSTFAALTEVDAAALDVDDIATQAVTNLTVGANGSSAYLFDQYTGDNPDIYVTAGQTIAFALDGVPTHPFRILDGIGGSQYDTGLVHYAQDGTKTTGSGAQDKTSGTLYWKVPASINGDYAYLCTAHAAMEGKIVIADPSASGGGGGSLQSRGTVVFNTSGSHANGATENDTGVGFKTYALLKIATDRAAWVRVYSTVAARTADAGRVRTTDPTPDAGVIAEVITTGAETVAFTPGVIGFNNETSPTTDIQIAVTNDSGSTSAVQVTLTLLQLEA